jgi:hypothetical protein
LLAGVDIPLSLCYRENMKAKLAIGKCEGESILMIIDREDCDSYFATVLSCSNEKCFRSELGCAAFGCSGWFLKEFTKFL